MTSFDQIAADLQARRVEAGSPSYAEIALRVGRLRAERGVPEAQARPARTTVYDAFRAGRRRLDTALVLDIVRALGADEPEVRDWEGRCRDAHAGGPPAAPTSTDAPAALEDTGDTGDTGVTGADLVPPPPVPLALRAALVICLGCVGLNLLNRVMVDALQIPLYLDMMGTAVAAVVLGPWWGAGVGLSTNMLGVPVSGWESAPFAIVNVVGALAWGYGVRRWRMGTTVPRFFTLNIAVALLSSLLAVPIILLVLDGETGNGADDVITTVFLAVESLWLAVASANVLTSLADKTISGFVALLAVDVLPRSVTARVRPLMPLAAARPEGPLP